MKLSIINRLEHGETATKLATEYGVGKATISGIKKSKSSLRDFASKMETNVGLKRKIMKNANDEALEKSMFAWFSQERSRGTPLSRFDYLRIGDGLDSDDRRSRVRRESGYRLPRPHTSATDDLWLLFITDGSVTYRGFNLTLQEEQDCIETLTIPTGGSVVISSPYYPQNYDHNTFCEWKVVADNGRNIRALVLDFDTERNYDTVNIGTGQDSTALRTRILQASGTHDQTTFYTGSHEIWTTFVTDNTFTRPGFQIEFFDDGCVNDIRMGTPGSIQSPNYPSDYANNADCVWIIQVNQGEMIKITFIDFHLENHYDTLLVGEGSDPNSDDYLKLTGPILPDPILSTGHEMWLRLKTDWNIVRRGFNLTYELQCPEGYEYHIVGGVERCYKFVKNVRDREPWNNARENCLSTEYGDLVIINDDVELQYVTDQMDGENYWIGYSDISVEGRWRWIDCRDSSEWDLSNWAEGEPSNEPYEDCALVDDLHWQDGNCRIPQYYVCEINYKEFEYPDDINVQAVDAVGISSYDIHVTWTVSDYNCDVIGYSVKYRRYDWLGGYMYTYVVGGDQSEVILTDLESATRYVIYVAGDTHKQLLDYVGPDTAWTYVVIKPPEPPVEPVKPCGANYTTKDDTFIQITSPNYPEDYDHNLLIHVVEQLKHLLGISRLPSIPIHIHMEVIVYGISMYQREYSGNDIPDNYISTSHQVWLRFQTDWSQTRTGFHLTYQMFVCPEGYEAHFVGDRYRCYKFVLSPSPWDDARDECLSTMHGDLVIIDDDIELEYVSNQMSDKGVDSYWIGYSDISVEGRWKWIDCRDSSEWDLSNWAEGEPSNGTYEDCALVDDLHWQDRNCRTLHYYVCEINRKEFEYPDDINVQAVDAVGLSPYNIHVTWTISDYNCDVIGYRVRYRRSDWLGGYTYLYVDGGDASEMILTDLESSTLYLSYVAAVTTKGRLDYVGPAEAWTHQVFKPPAPPVEPEKCEGNYTTKNGTILRITSPGYPDDYDNNENCEWLVTASSPDSTFIVHLRDLSTEKWFDYLDIGEGHDLNDASTRVHHMSGRIRPWFFWSSSTDKLWFNFYSDFWTTYRGFMVDIEEILTEVPPTQKPIPVDPEPEDPEPPEECGGNITIALGGSINLTLLHYPENYEDNLNCLWLINTESKHRVNVTFIDFETEYCHDWLEIGNTHDYKDLTTSTLRVSGDDAPDDHISTVDEIWITFKTDYAITFRGFHLLLTEYIESDVICGGDLTIPAVVGASVDITSPNYPDHYNNNDYCKWTISVVQPVKTFTGIYHMYVRINSFDTELNFDWLEIGSGHDDSDFDSLLFRFSGSDVSGSYVTNHDEVWALWTSDRSFTKQGFNVTFFIVFPCGGSLFGPSGNITSPGYPNRYPHGSNCRWDILVDSDKLIKFSFHVFDLENNYDYLYLGDEISDSNLPLVELTGDELPKDEVLDTYHAWVHFTSDLSGDGDGFYLTYEEYEEELLIAKPCGGAFETKPDSKLVIQSPNYPSQYNNNERCVWNVTSSPGTRMSVRFRDFVTEPGHDWVDVGNGLDESDLSTRERHHSGFIRPVSWLSAEEALWITFTTDDSVIFRGFLIYIEERNDRTTISGTTIKATTVSPTPYCGGFISVPSDGVETVISPNYPEDYDDNLLCEWTVSASPGKRIRVHVEDFKTEKRHDYLDLGDGYDMDKETSRFETLTGNEKEQSHVTATDKMWMRFVTDHRKTYRGFKINLSEENECVNQSVVIPTGGSTIITSPNYPENYEDSVFCEWIVSTESLGNIRVYVDHFKTERNYDWVDMGTESNSMNLSTRILHESGNKKTPHEFYTPSSIVWLTFMSDHDKTDDGFHMQLFDDACVETTLTDPSGIILSPNYPDDYPHNLDCIWYISLPADSKIHLFFVDFYVEKKYDKLLIGEGLDADSQDYVEFTDRHDGEEYRSDSNALWLRFQTDWDKSKRGFDIRYTSSDCPEGYEPGYNHGCYKFVEDPEDWDEARQDCESTEDGDLVITDSEDELDYVMRELVKRNMATTWIGYYDKAIEGNWVWVDCSESTDWQENNWADNEPDGETNQNCAAVNTDGNWIDQRCSRRYPYVCEITYKRTMLI
ncbi:cubilin-like [Saccoglossus kowalevskii]